MKDKSTTELLTAAQAGRMAQDVLRVRRERAAEAAEKQLPGISARIHAAAANGDCSIEVTCSEYLVRAAVGERLRQLGYYTRDSGNDCRCLRIEWDESAS